MFSLKKYILFTFQSNKTIQPRIFKIILNFPVFTFFHFLKIFKLGYLFILHCLMFRMVVFEKSFSFVFQFTILSFSNLFVLFLTKLSLVFLYLFFILASSDECLINLLRLCVCSKMNLIFCFQFISILQEQC